MNNYEDIFMSAPIGMLISRNRIIEQANPVVAEMFRYDLAQMQGLSIEFLFPTSIEFERAGIRIRESMTKNGYYSDERIMKRSNNELFWCRAAGRAEWMESPHSSCIWVLEDISHKRAINTKITAREREVATLLMEGKTSKYIARKIELSPRTVEMHRANLMKKLVATTSSELVHKLMSCPI
jgi:PAS domain S-box-containing protein